MTRITCISVLAFLFIMVSCAKDQTDPPDNSCGSDLDYLTNIKPIIDASCALSGCHDGTTGIGDYSNYDGLEQVLRFGSFANRVIDQRENPVVGMPPDNAVDVGGVADLQDEEIEMIMEWLDNGFPREAEPVIATYDENVKFIIDTNCSYAGCHNGQPGTPGVYTTYGGLSGDLENGRFFNKVVELRDDPVLGMPPDESATNLGGPANLTEEEFQIILCWIENDYPEN